MKKTQDFDMKPVPLKRPVDKLARGAEVAALNSLLDMMNNPEITGAVVPKGEQTKAEITRATAFGPESGPAINPHKPISVAAKGELLDKTGASIIAGDPAVTAQPIHPSWKTAPYPAHPVPDLTKRRAATGSKIFFTGLIGAGKDFCAEQLGAKIFGLADPLYHLAEYFFGVTITSKEGKQLPGMRAFLQVCGQYGRGDASEQYPYTAARACFISMIRSLGEGGRFDAQYEIDWGSYGKNADIWLDGLNRRIVTYQAGNPESRVVVTNVRFKNEYVKLRGFGFEHWHVMASPQTRATRVKVAAPAANDTSEQLANFLNNDVTQKISKQPRGNKLHVVWNDTVASPSPRLYTVAEWLQEAATDNNIVVTGE